MVDLASLKSLNSERWRKAKLTRAGEFYPVAKRLIASKLRFQSLEARTGVPWFIIAVIKERESGADPNFLGNIANGQPWSKVTTIEPIGRGPFTSWEAAAIDALVNCHPYASKWKDWTPGGAMTLLEQYNGFGYAAKGLPSPYVWSGTDRYVSGKYVADHVFDPNVVDKQLGCAGILLAMMELDPSVSFIRANVPPPPDVVPPQALPAPTNWLVSLITALINAFKRKSP